MRRLKDVLAATTIRKRTIVETKFRPAIILEDGETWAGLDGCTLLITDDELCGMAQNDVVGQTNKRYPDHETYGEYALGQLVKDLPMETLRKYKVVAYRAPEPRAVRGKK